MKSCLGALALALVTFAVNAADGDDAAFGLKWGMTPAAVRAAGVSITLEKSIEGIESYKATSMPRSMGDADFYGLIFAEGKLSKLTYVSNNIVNDSTGSDGKARFESISNNLTQKYGQPSNTFMYTARKLYREYDEFYQCLTYDGCGSWVAFWKTPDKSMALELRGLARGKGFISVAIEAVPQWSEALDRRKARRGASDKNAL